MQQPRDFPLCYRAFTELYIKLDRKTFAPCCYFDGSSEFTAGLDFHADIRRDNLDYRWAKGCEHCKRAEELGSVSHRLEYHHQARDPQLISENRFELRHLELKLDKTCNIACITCGEHSSSRWSAENHRMSGKEIKPGPKQQDLDWILDLGLWKSVETLVLYGGEPFYSKKLKKILSWLIQNDLSQRIAISFYTNGTIFDPEALSMLGTFKSVNLQFSIDGIGENFEIIRWPARWNDLLQTIEGAKSFANIKVSANYLVSILNVFNVKDDYHHLLDHMVGEAGLNFLEKPEHFNIKHLPQEFKQQLISDLADDFLMEPVVRKLSRPGDPNQLVRAFSNLKRLDRFRNTHSPVLFPKALLDHYGFDAF
jgi:Radical SAM superfamily/4Fe-4S single cluster domain